MEDEQADAGRDGRTRLARPISRARTGTGKYSFLSETEKARVGGGVYSDRGAEVSGHCTVFYLWTRRC